MRVWKNGRSEVQQRSIGEYWSDRQHRRCRYYRCLDWLGRQRYNNLVTLKNRVKNGWAQIDVQLKQLADLIPNLVNTVKGYASHESEVFTQVTAARAGVVAAASNPSTTTAQRAAAENQLSRALFNLQATAEAYPQLQANQNFMDLQNQLKELENKIAYARQIYNDVVLKLNTAIETVPTNIIAGFVPL